MRTPRSRLASARARVCMCGGRGWGEWGVGSREGVGGVAAERGFDHFL